MAFSANSGLSTDGGGHVAFAAWAMMRFSLTVFFVVLGVYVIVAALLRPSHFHKPYIDQTLV